MLDPVRFGQKIRYYRHQLGITQSELADRIHVSFQAISSWECGNTLPDIENLCRLSDVLCVSVDELLQKGASQDESLLIAVDGGGTSTEFVLFTSSGRILKRIKLPGSNVSNIGITEGLAIYHRGFDMCLTNSPDIEGIFIGCAGGHLEEITHRLCEHYQNIPIRIDSHGVNALASAEGDAALICGTGTVILKRDESDSYHKIGGWGHIFGDPGSGYSFGREAVYAALSYEDGVIDSPTIYCILKEKMGISKIRGEFTNVSVTKIAELANVIFEAYEQNDPIAIEIVESEMKKLAPLVNCSCPDGGCVILCGGINEYHNHITLPVLRKYISSDISFVLPKLPPIYGACNEACRIFGVAQDEHFFENFYKDYRKLL